MSLAIAFVGEKGAALVADTGVWNGNSRDTLPEAESKIVRYETGDKTQMAIAVCGTLAVVDWLRWRFEPEPVEFGSSVRSWVSGQFRNDLMSQWKEQNVPMDGDDEGIIPASLLILVAGRVFEIDPNLAVCEVLTFAAIGTPWQMAQGAAAMLVDLDTDFLKAPLTSALSVAECIVDHSDGIAAPFDWVSSIGGDRRVKHGRTDGGQRLRGLIDPDDVSD